MIYMKNTNDISKVLLVAGWIPVDQDSFRIIEIELKDPSIELYARLGQGFLLQSEGEFICGPLTAIQAVKIK
jgi:hypothetical protein